MEFDYIIEKIKTARFSTEPFKHIYLENFLSDEHFNLLTTCKKINILTADSTVNLIKYLEKNGYRIQPFPGCITSVEEYIKCLESNIWPVDKERLEGFGMAFGLAKTSYSEIIKIINFLNGDIFKLAIESTFGIVRQNRIETAIHKYLSGYEISPHPDIRSKCLTYLLNINTNNFLESDNIHTHLLKFKPENNFIYDYWKNNTKYDTDWVPWEWCETKKKLSEKIIVSCCLDRLIIRCML